MSAANSAFYSLASQTLTHGFLCEGLASETRLFSLSSNDSTSRSSPTLLVLLLDSYSCMAEPLLELAALLKADELLLELAANLANSSCDSHLCSVFYLLFLYYALRRESPIIPVFMPAY